MERYNRTEWWDYDEEEGDHGLVAGVTLLILAAAVYIFGLLWNVGRLL